MLTGLSTMLSAQSNTPDAVLQFIARFEKAVITHQYDSVMRYMDKEYVRLQHNKMLKKNTVQFIDEFFGGNEQPDRSGNYTAGRLTDISEISVHNIENLGNEEYGVLFKITQSGSGVHYCNVLLRTFKKRLGFFGVMG